MTETSDNIVLDADLLSREAARLTIGYLTERVGARLVIIDKAIRESTYALNRRSRDSRERNAAKRIRDHWLDEMRKHGRAVDVSQEQILKHIDSNRDDHEWVEERWESVDADPDDIEYVNAGIATQSRYVLTGNARMIDEKDLEAMVTEGPQSVPRILRKDKILEMFAARLGITPEHCIEHGLVATSPDHRNYPGLTARVTRALKASFPTTIREMRDNQRPHGHYLALKPYAKIMPATAAAHRSRVR